jgi:hypothetical protein
VIVHWGDCFDSCQCCIPHLPPGVTYVQIAGGDEHCLARRSDGIVVAWGYDGYGECGVPPLPPGTTYVDIAATNYHSVARRSDGVIVGFGNYFQGKRYLPELPAGLKYVGVYTDGVGLFEGCPTCYAGFCDGDTQNAEAPCPCENPGASDHGCNNSASTGGAHLAAHGVVDPDRVVLAVSGEIGSSSSFFLQGTSVIGTAAVLGDGLRCIGGRLTRIAVRTANAGSTSYPMSGDPSITARSAALGDPISAGQLRYYQVLYRDPGPGLCNSRSASLNTSNAVLVAW